MTAGAQCEARTSDHRVPVPVRALAQRINRVLARRRLMLRKTPWHDTKALKDFGEYFVFDVRNDVIADTHTDIEDYGRKLNVLRPHEYLQPAPRPSPETGSRRR